MNLTQIYGQAWREPTFKQQLLNQPQATLAQVGITYPEGVKVTVLEESKQQRYLVLSQEVSQEDDILAAINRKAAQDASFRQQLLASPKTSLEQEFGIKLPEEVAVDVVVETEATRYFVLPAQPDMEYVIYRAWQDELFKQQLLENTKATLANLGISTPEDVEFKAVEETDFNRYILLSSAGAVALIPQDEETDPFASLKAKAVQDSAFKEALIDRPKTTIEQEMGLSLPSWVDVEVLEATAKTSFLIIPHLPDAEELAEDEMMAVAGGWRIRARGRTQVDFRRGISYERNSGQGWRIGW